VYQIHTTTANSRTVVCLGSLQKENVADLRHQSSLANFIRLLNNQNPSAHAHFLYYPPPTSSSYLKCFSEILWEYTQNCFGYQELRSLLNSNRLYNLTDLVQANQLSFRHYPKLILVQ
jgi:hypothetical protein